ncbi:MAG: hypothetical protein U9N35_02435 [Euryarchaeota archaeon]|nr:hypothetical protein [Euryarchaeota archaeon]
MNKKLEQHMTIISNLANGGPSLKDSKKITEKEVILKFLGGTEKEVMKKLIKNEGTLLQSKMSREDEMTPLKVHRAVKKLEKKGIVQKESYGKTNRITLTDDVKNILL